MGDKIGPENWLVLNEMRKKKLRILKYRMSFGKMSINIAVVGTRVTEARSQAKGTGQKDRSGEEISGHEAVVCG